MQIPISVTIPDSSMKNPPNIVMIVLDTARKDSLGVYNSAVSTPHMDEFSKEAVVYRNAVSPAPWTIPSHASIFTGMYPSEHGFHETLEEKIDILKERNGLMASRTISGNLKKKGYDLIGYSANALISSETGFDAWFNSFMFKNIESFSPQSGDKLKRIKEKVLRDRFNGNDVSRSQILKSLLKDPRTYPGVARMSASVIMKSALEISNGYPLEMGGAAIADTISKSSFETPFFLFVNLMETHEPYPYNLKSRFLPLQAREVNERFDDWLGYRTLKPSQIRGLTKAFYRESEQVDHHVGKILEFLKSSVDWDNTMVIITADHGQALREKNFYGHGVYLYDEIVEIPLIIKYPKGLEDESLRDGKYQTTAALYDLIAGISEGKKPESFSRDMVFSEAFGIPNSLDRHRARHGNDPEYNRKVSEMDALRKSVYKNGFKLTVNGTTGEIEEFLKGSESMDPKEYIDTVRDMVDEIDIFTGNANFKLPDLNSNARQITSPAA